MTQRSLSSYVTRLSILSFFPLILLATILAFNIIHEQQNDIRQQAQLLADNIANDIDSYLDSRIRALKIIAYSPHIFDQDKWEELYNEAQAFKMSFDSHVILADVSSASMQMLFNTGVPFSHELPSLPVPKGTDAVKEVLQTNLPAVGETFQGSLANEPLVAIAVPVLKDSDVNYIVLSIIETRLFQNKVENIIIPESWHLLITDTKGDVIAKNNVVNATTKIGDSDFYIVKSSPSLANWQISLQIPQSYLSNPLLSAIGLFTFVIALTTLVGFVVGKTASVKLGRQVAALAKVNLDNHSSDILEIAQAQNVLSQRGAALIESEKKYKELFKSNPNPMWIYDIETLAFLEVNDAALNKYGYSRDEFLTKTIKDIRPKEDINRLLENVANITDDLDNAGDWRHITKSGQIIFVEITSHYLVYEGRKAELVLVNDITERKLAEDVIKKSEAAFRQLAEAMPQVVWVADSNGHFIQINQQWVDYTGLPREQSYGEGWLNSVYEEDLQELTLKWQTSVKTHSAFEYELRLVGRDGLCHWFLARAIPALNDTGIIEEWYGTFTNIESLKQAEQAVQTRAKQQKILADLGLLAMKTDDIQYLFEKTCSAVTDGLNDSQCILFTNSEASANFSASAFDGWKAETVEKIRQLDDLPPHLMSVLKVKQPATFAEIDVHNKVFVQQLFPSESISSMIALPLSNKNIWGVMAVYSSQDLAFTSNDKAFLQSICNNLIASINSKEINEKLGFMAMHDGLTNLPNRSLLADRFEQVTAHSKRSEKPIALLFLDLDRFKNLNDVFGHSVGDEVLKEIAKRLERCTRGSDTVCRQGGDEFLILLSDMEHQEDAVRVAEKILNAINYPIHINNTEMVLGGTIGIACYPDDGQDIETLMRCADTAMYHAKNTGRNHYEFYSQEMNSRSFERLMLEGELHQAIAKNQLFVVYQPQFNLADNTIIGAEALVRWQHPKFGLVSPGSFIPLAEDSGLIQEIGSWVMENACSQFNEWINAKLLKGTIAINVSSFQFQQSNFLELVEGSLIKSGLAPEHLELEVTESVVMHGHEMVIEKLKHLHSLGIKLAIDDFGTGFSSLSYLQKFPINRLKIDQSFVKGLPENPESCSIVEAVIQLGHALDLDVLAEGIEKPEQQSFLKAADCESGQGYLFSKPLEASDFTKFLNRLK